MGLLEIVKKEIPDIDINVNDNDLEEELKANIALYLYSRGYITSGIGAKFLSKSRVEFLFLAAKYKIPMFEYSKDEVKRELNNG